LDSNAALLVVVAGVWYIRPSPFEVATLEVLKVATTICGRGSAACEIGWVIELWPKISTSLDSNTIMLKSVTADFSEVKMNREMI